MDIQQTNKPLASIPHMRICCKLGLQHVYIFIGDIGIDLERTKLRKYIVVLKAHPKKGVDKVEQLIVDLTMSITIFFFNLYHSILLWTIGCI